MEVLGARLLPGLLSPAEQSGLLAEVLAAAAAAPFRRPTIPGGRTMSVLQTNLGPLGWTADASGYRYRETDPETGRPWPALPERLSRLWSALLPTALPCDSCLVNWYRPPAARMGLHRDQDEADLTQPILSLSLGDEAVFRLGGPGRSDPTRSLPLRSGDGLILEGPARGARHGVDRVRFGSSRLVPGGGRLNLTLRRAR